MIHAPGGTGFKLIQKKMSTGPTFEEYLISKKIDSDLFRRAEPEIWNGWKNEFEQMNPNSFTVQKLNLINPIRRKYQMKISFEEKKPTEPPSSGAPAPKPGRPIIRPKLG